MNALSLHKDHIAAEFKVPATIHVLGLYKTATVMNGIVRPIAGDGDALPNHWSVFIATEENQCFIDVLQEVLS